jgi:hypothetical protein
MAGRIGNILRFVALLGLAVLLAACAPVEGPSFGSGPPVLSPKTLKTLSKPTPVTAEVRFALDPITNAPGEMIYAYQDTLKAKAATRQLKILATDDPTANYRLKIYLSAVGDYSATLMLYVVDIFDEQGVRIHRISGQITAGGSLNDPWANIRDTGVVTQAAQETIDALGNWAHS